MPYVGLAGSIDDFDDGSIAGDENNVTLVETPGGMGVAFGTGTDSRIEYDYVNGFPRSGTFEMTVKVESGFAYRNAVLDPDTTAYLFGTDISGGDVTWPGSAWLTAKEDGTLRFSLAQTKYAGGSADGTFILAENTGFEFGEWHTISISFGSEGMSLALDGQVLGTTANTQTLAGGGTHGQSLGQPTIGEPVPSFWSEDRWEGGFNGVVEAVRISDVQNDFVLADYSVEPVSYATTAALFAADGKQGFLAELSLAAYHLESQGAHESTIDGANTPNPLAETAYDGLPEGFVLLDAGLDQAGNLGPFTGTLEFPRDGFNNGIYTHENAAALVGRSDDALFIAFRGTNDPQDRLDWLDRREHFDLFLDLLDILGTYLEAHPEITQIYLTGHSLGGAMVQGFSDLFGYTFYGVDVEAVTFASPGYDSGEASSDAPENTHGNWQVKGDVVPWANLGPGVTSGDINVIRHDIWQTFKDNRLTATTEAEFETTGTVFDLHSMALYNDFIEFFAQHGVTGGPLANDIDYDRYYAHVEVINVPNQDYVIGSLRDEITGSSRKDAIFGGLQSDTLNGTGGDDYVNGGSGRDVLMGGDQNDYILGGLGKDTISGGRHDDSLFGNGKDDSIDGGKGQDEIHGNTGNDTLIGGKGQDSLYGGNGADELNGGRQDDRLEGGKGADHFIYENRSANDIIVDFEDDRDTIWLDNDLWIRERTAQEVVNDFGEIVDGDAVLSFGFGFDSLTIEGVGSLSVLWNDIVIF